MATLADLVAQAITERMKTAPTSLQSQVHGPVIVPPEKLGAWNEIREKRESLLALARDIDELIGQF